MRERPDCQRGLWDPAFTIRKARCRSVENSSQTVAMMYTSTNNDGRFLPRWNGRRTRLEARTRTFESLASVQRMKYPSVGNNGIRLRIGRSHLMAAANTDGADQRGKVHMYTPDD